MDSKKNNKRIMSINFRILYKWSKKLGHQIDIYQLGVETIRI